MSNIDESYVIDEYLNNNKSTIQLAKELDTYPNKIKRILQKHGHGRRSRSEGQIAALEAGRAKHPTLGKERTKEEKISISKGVEKNWDNMPKDKRKQISADAKKRWDKIPPTKKREMQEMAGRALRQASIDGSKAEKSLKEKLEENGYTVVLHKKNLIPGQYEIDLFLPELKTIIEIDGPQHFLPIWGEDKLQQVIKSDETKNGLLLSHGYCVIRIKYICKNMTLSLGGKLWEIVKPCVEKIEKKFPSKQKRFIELEITK
mgnify:CR=1 FL=1